MSPHSIRPKPSTAQAENRFDIAVRRWSAAVVRDDTATQFVAATHAGLFAPDPERAARFDHAALAAAARLTRRPDRDVTVLAARVAAVAAHAALQHQRLDEPEEQDRCDRLADRLRLVGLTTETLACIGAVD